MKNVLFILPFYPLPLKSGGHQAIFNGMIAVKNYVNIHICYDSGRKDLYKSYHAILREELGDNIKICPYTYEVKKMSIREFFKKLFRKVLIHFKENDDELFESMTKIKIHPNNYYIHINEIIKKYNIDIVQIEMMSNIDVVLSLPKNVQKIFVHHEIQYVRNMLYLSSSKNNNYYKRALFKIEKEKEKFLLNQYDKIITLSHVDKKKLEGIGIKVPIHTSFATIKTTKPNITFSHRTNNILSFVGPESHIPNKIGLLYFLENCWDTLSSKGYTLQIIGNWNESTIQELSKIYPNINFLGYVDDLVSYLYNTIMIVPITIGSGIRMKILEAMGNQIPIVSTSVGAEGIPIINNINCFIADTPEDFINSIIKLEDENLRQKFIKSAYEIVQQQFSIKALSLNRMAIYN